MYAQSTFTARLRSKSDDLICTPAPRIRQNLLYEFVRIRSAFRLIDEFARRQLCAFDNGANFAKSALDDDQRYGVAMAESGDPAGEAGYRAE